MPTSLRIFQVDAFAGRAFSGNPAAVCLLDAPVPDDVLQAVARENNLSETAFFRPDDERPRLRWFTPSQEVPLCGHATLASGWVALERLRPGSAAVTFESLSGPLTVSRADDGFRLDLPRLSFEQIDQPPTGFVEGLGARPQQVLRIPDDPNYLVILETEEEVAGLDPDLRILEGLHPFGVAVSAPGRDADFVSRYFAPSYGIPEDPATGSIHCALGPYWQGRWGREEMTALQLSERRGRLGVRVAGDRVHLTGEAHLYLEGEIFV